MWLVVLTPCDYESDCHCLVTLGQGRQGADLGHLGIRSAAIAVNVRPYRFGRRPFEPDAGVRESSNTEPQHHTGSSRVVAPEN